MKKFKVLFLFILMPVLVIGQNKLDSLLNVLDKTVDNYQMYADQKEKKLTELNIQLSKSISANEKYLIYNQLYDEFRSYKSDSALKYAKLKLQIAENLKNVRLLYESRLDLAMIWCVSGMYKESLELLQTLDKNKATGLKIKYFETYKSVMGYMSDYVVSEEKSIYDSKKIIFRDSLLAYLDPASSAYFIDKTYVLCKQQQDSLALKILLNHFFTIKKNEIRNKAYVAFTISAIYKHKRDKQNQKYWLIVSSINDLQSINKEYISLSKLAFILYEDGDIVRSYKYIKRSLEDALFCNSQIRTYGISQMLPIIDNAYQAQKKSRQKILIISLISISILSLFLISAILIVNRQMKKLVIARLELSKVNIELSTINSELKGVNKSLSESNIIKEEYIGRYIDQCSVYLDKLDNYRRLLNKTATAGKIEELIHIIKSKQFIQDELKAFYDNFDITFIHLFPTFVMEFSKLLLDEDYFQLKPGQILNTELRIYALIRLGITDVTKMSDFLRCSASTIYNCRYKIKTKTSYSREEFEEKVMQIGSFSN